MMENLIHNEITYCDNCQHVDKHSSALGAWRCKVVIHTIWRDERYMKRHIDSPGKRACCTDVNHDGNCIYYERKVSLWKQVIKLFRKKFGVKTV